MRIVQRFGFSRRNQGGRQQRRAQKGQQVLQDFVVRQAQAYGFARRVAQAARHLFAGLQDKGVRAGRGAFEQAELAVIDPGVAGQFAQVAAQQGQVVFVVHATDATQAVGCGFVIKMADQRVAGIGGNRQHAAFFQHGHGLLEQARLRVVRVDFKQLGHAGLCAGDALSGCAKPATPKLA